VILNFKDLSVIQQEKYKSICGCDYGMGTFKSRFMTDAPYNDHEWKYSPWLFKFQIREELGYLYCFIVHRMTNDSTYGWDYEGNELSGDEIEKILYKT